MQRIFIIIHSIYFVKHTLVFLYNLIYYNPNLYTFECMHIIMKMTLKSISSLISFLKTVRGM